MHIVYRRPSLAGFPPPQLTFLCWRAVKHQSILLLFSRAVIMVHSLWQDGILGLIGFRLFFSDNWTYICSYKCSRKSGSFFYWWVRRPASRRFFIHSYIYLRILSYLATFLCTNSLSVLMWRKAVNQSINIDDCGCESIINLYGFLTAFSSARFSAASVSWKLPNPHHWLRVSFELHECGQQPSNRFLTIGKPPSWSSEEPCEVVIS